MNSLLQLNVTKVEQCGTGYVLDEKPLVHQAARPSTSDTLQIGKDLILTHPQYSAAFCQIFDSVYCVFTIQMTAPSGFFLRLFTD